LLFVFFVVAVEFVSASNSSVQKVFSLLFVRVCCCCSSFRCVVVSLFVVCVVVCLFVVCFFVFVLGRSLFGCYKNK
jgi:hypothetical protein